MISYLMALGCSIWKSVVTGYDIPSSPPSDTNEKKLSNDNARVVNAIIGGLTNSIFVKCKTTKDIWDNIQLIDEGDTKVKQAKLQTHKGQFENMKMKEEENMAEYLLRVDEVVNTIRGLGE